MENGYIKFWGVRGSHPTPDKDKIDFGGDTSCVEVRTKNDLFVFDMGSGLRNFGENMLKKSSTPKNVHIFLSHYHWDHIVGFLSFKPLFNSSFKFHIYGANKNTTISSIADKLLDQTVWPVSMDMLLAEVNFIDLNDKKIKINEEVSIDHIDHPHPNGATSYKININNFSILYTTDCEHEDNILNENVLKIAKNANIIIHDSHFMIEDLQKHKGWGHSSWKNAVDLANTSNADQLILFHFSPEYNDQTIIEMEKQAKKYFINSAAAKQGMKIPF